MDMVRRMRSHVELPKFLWIEGLNKVMCIVNQVLTKVVLRTPFELCV